MAVQGWCHNSLAPMGAKLFRHRPWTIMVYRHRPWTITVVRMWREYAIMKKDIEKCELNGVTKLSYTPDNIRLRVTVKIYEYCIINVSIVWKIVLYWFMIRLMAVCVLCLKILYPTDKLRPPYTDLGFFFLPRSSLGHVTIWSRCQFI